MPSDRLTEALNRHVTELDSSGTAKGAETVVVGVKRAEGDRGPRFLLAGEGEKEFMRMNSNSYMGLGLHPAVIDRKSTRLNSSHSQQSRMPSSA